MLPIRNNLFRLLLISAAFTSCKKDPDAGIPPPDISAPGRKMLVLNQGLFNMNNTTLSLYSFERAEVLTNDLFAYQNQRGLGDTGNDMAIYGTRVYIVMSTSSQVEVSDMVGKSIKRIPLFTADNKPRQPRSIAFHAGKAYVCSFDGTVARIDTASLTVEAVTAVGRNPDGICVSGNKLYVSNSGGLDFPNYDSTVSVVGLAEFREIKKIGVRMNPYTIAADAYGDVYVASRGNYANVKYCLQRIDTRTDELVQTFDNLKTLSFVIYNDRAYSYNYDFNLNTTSFEVLNVKTEQIETEQFITDGTTLSKPFGIAVDPVTEDVYIADAGNYTVNGDVFCFSKTGMKKFKTTVGMNPQKMIFIEN